MTGPHLHLRVGVLEGKLPRILGEIVERGVPVGIIAHVADSCHVERIVEPVCDADAVVEPAQAVAESVALVIQPRLVVGVPKVTRP
jgi:hypothetical protein